MAAANSWIDPLEPSLAPCHGTLCVGPKFASMSYAEDVPASLTYVQALGSRTNGPALMGPFGNW